MRILLIILSMFIFSHTADALQRHRSYWIKLPKTSYLVDLTSFHWTKHGIAGRFYDPKARKSSTVKIDLKRCDKAKTKIASNACHLLKRYKDIDIF